MRQPIAGRTPLSREAVVRRAVQLADQDGVGALSMRRLADELGVVPMALYKHVIDKEDLLDAMVDHLLAGIERVDDPDLPWPEAVRRTVWAARRTVVAHPWLRRVLETRTLRTAAVLGHMEALTSMMLLGGLSADLTHHAMHALGNRIWGFSPELFDDGGNATPRRSSAAPPDPAGHPGILAVSASARALRPGAAGCDEDFEFAFALDLLLDAVTRLDAAGWSSSPTVANG